MTRTTIECISNYMQVAEVDVTETELREYCKANSCEDISTTFDASLCILLDANDITYYPENETFELGGA